MPFLDHFQVEPLTGRVAFLNYEMNEHMFRDWATALGIERPERIARPLHLRGERLLFWQPEVRDELADWLRSSEVEFLIVDPAARAGGGLVDNENDNAQVGRFTDALDELKRAAGVPDLLLATHTGRARAEEDEERSRGATRLEDWADSLWYLTKDKTGTRYLRAVGRDVELEATELQYDEQRRRCRTTGQTRTERRQEDGIQAAVDALAVLTSGGDEPPTTTELAEVIEGDKTRRSGWIKDAEFEGYIVREQVGRKKLCRLTEQGWKLHGRRVGSKGRSEE